MGLGYVYFINAYAHYLMGAHNNHKIIIDDGNIKYIFIK